MEVTMPRRKILSLASGNTDPTMSVKTSKPAQVFPPESNAATINPSGRFSAGGASKEQILEEYRQAYDIDNLATPNDKANLDTMIMNTLAIRLLQQQLLELTIDSVVNNAVDIKKINDSIRDLTNVNLTIERQLSIDRKTRKSENEQSVVEYINFLKETAREFLDDSSRLLKVYCKKCNIMVGRVSGVYETTEYTCYFQCPQCRKNVEVRRKEKDIFFDVKDPDWRRKYPVEIIQPRTVDDGPDIPLEEVEDDLIITDPTINDDSSVQEFNELQEQKVEDINSSEVKEPAITTTITSIIKPQESRAPEDDVVISI